MSRAEIVFRIAVVALIFGGMYVHGKVSAQAERPRDWTYVWCARNDCIKKTLDALPVDRAAEAKLTTWENTTYVWYRK